MAYYNPFSASFKTGDLVRVSADGENFGGGCGYVERIAGITSPEFGVYQYIIQSTMPDSKPYKVHPSRIIKRECKQCHFKDECKHYQS